MPLAVSASLAAGMHAAIFGSGPLFTVPHHTYAGIDKLPVFCVLGLACGLLAVVICRGLYIVEAGFRRLPVGEFWHPIIGAIGFASIGLLVPRALGVGYDAIDDVLASKIAVAALVVLLIGKLAAWWVALGSGTSGGTLAPILLVSGAFGGLCGSLVNEVLPGLHLSAGAVALVAMAATFGAATRATFTAIVFAFELTQDYNSILPLMLAAVLADLVSAALLDHGLMTEKLARRGLRVPLDYSPDVLTSTVVGHAMTRAVDTLPADATVQDARLHVEASRHSAYPLVDDHGRCVGIVTRGDLLTGAVENEQPVASLASSDVVAIGADATLLEALELIVDGEVDHLPVIDGNDRIVGICTRTDILRARSRHLEHERLQPGWTARRR